MSIGIFAALVAGAAVAVRAHPFMLRGTPLVVTGLPTITGADSRSDGERDSGSHADRRRSPTPARAAG